MPLTNRLARLSRVERKLEERTGGDYSRHWEKRNRERYARLCKLAEAVPETHRDAVEPVLVHVVAPALFVAGPAWLPDDAPAVARWAIDRVDWGDAHPWNRPIGEPVPAGLLDLLLARPDANLHHARCRGCDAHVPCDAPGPDPDGCHRRRPVPLAPACFYCGAPTAGP